MNINLTNAISHFYPNPCYEQIYFESIANAIDAEATEVNILLKIDSFDHVDTLTISVSDNGTGFTDIKFEKFSRLLEVENKEHKGLGRLVYLYYFSEVDVVSNYDGNKKRTFVFDKNFSGKSKISAAPGVPSGTTLTFQKFTGDRIKTYEYLKPSRIKEALIEHFFPLFFKQKVDKKPLSINIELQTVTPNKEHDFYSDKQTLTMADVPELRLKSFNDNELDFFQKIEIHYSIKQDNARPKSAVTSICIDGRSMHFDLIPHDAIPGGHQMLFLFASSYFQGKADTSRQKLVLSDAAKEKILKRVLRREIGHIISDEVPIVKKTNEATRAELEEKYPHLHGYFGSDPVGLIVRNEVIQDAQERFFEDQKQILECTDLDEARYEKALNLSARTLTEYILYRARIITKLKTMDLTKSETAIHNLIIPKHKTWSGNNLADDMYSNNVWMLDDKFMSYSTVLSDEVMSKVIKELASADENDENRPDITLVFSGNPLMDSRVDVVVVELKKHGLKLAKNEEVVSQLRQRARKLLCYFPNKINRIWFYGITEINDEFKRSLKEDGYKELFSHGTTFFKAQPIIFDDKADPFPVDMHVMTYDTLINDAESRNSTFLRILKSTMRKVTDSIAITSQHPEITASIASNVN